MQNNINTRKYWEGRFSSGDWATKNGRLQTQNFAKGIIPHLQIPRGFNGTILDFGCGLGDAIPIYRAAFPQAKLIGVDISQSAVDQCEEEYGNIASFYRGEYQDIPEVDIIISSNVFEHITGDREISRHLLNICSSLYIVVPYKEDPMIDEHVNFYDEKYYSGVGNYDYTIFNCKGWTPFGPRGLWYEIYLKNIYRQILGKPRHNRNKQIVFHFRR